MRNSDSEYVPDSDAKTASHSCATSDADGARRSSKPESVIQVCPKTCATRAASACATAAGASCRHLRGVRGGRARGRGRGRPPAPPQAGHY